MLRVATTVKSHLFHQSCISNFTSHLLHFMKCMLVKVGSENSREEASLTHKESLTLEPLQAVKAAIDEKI